MRHIDIEYRVWWWPWKRRCHGRVPTSWKDLDVQRFLMVVGAMLGRVDADEYLSCLCGLPVRMVRRLDEWQRYQVEQLLGWMSSDRQGSSLMFINRIEKLSAPESGLSNMTLQQFMTADTFFGYVCDSMKADGRQGAPLNGDIRLLCQFVASLYMRRGERYQVDKVRRTIFDLPGQDERLVDIGGNARMLERRADRLLLWGVYVNWLLVKVWLAKAFPLVFPEGDEDEGGRVRNAWLNAFDTFVGDDVAHLDAYRSMPCTDAFRIMSHRIKNSLTK